ncbi:MAG: 4Fe-4S binding protein, partial [Oscillospiraceae bacterium]|nr:4Fe-4S binding protein [Oscillospiraceae bacterium]
GYRIIDDLKAGLNLYLTEKNFESLSEARGLALDSVSETTDVLERDTVVYPHFFRERCIGCGRCSISCADGGHQAIRMGKDGKPTLDAARCVGCHLCVLVCPQRAIRPSRIRREKKQLHRMADSSEPGEPALR